MSQLANAFRTWATGLTGFSTYFNGGMFPDNAPRNTTGSRLTYAITKGAGRNPVTGLAGTPLARTERIQIEITAATRILAQAARDWLADQIGQAPSMITAGTLTVKQWRVDDDGTEDDEDRADGSDENLRTVILDIVGSY